MTMKWTRALRLVQPFLRSLISDREWPRITEDFPKTSRDELPSDEGRRNNVDF